MRWQLLRTLNALVVLLTAGCGNSREGAVGEGGTVLADRVLVQIASDADDHARLYAVDASAVPRLIPSATRADVGSFNSARLESARRSDEVFERFSGRLEGADLVRGLSKGSYPFAVDPTGRYAVRVNAMPAVESIVDVEQATRLQLTSLAGKQLAVPLAWCRDGRHLAVCEVRVGSVDQVLGMLIVDVAADRVSGSHSVRGEIKDISWNHSCTKLAVLLAERKSGGGPVERLGSLMGHGVPYLSFKLITVDAASGARQELDISDDVKYGWGAVVWDSEGGTCLADEGMGARPIEVVGEDH